MRRDRNEAAGRIAAGQHGLITRAQAVSVGFDSSAIHRNRASGRWCTVAPGVYLVVGAPRTWHTNLLAECLSTGGVASHRSAAALLGIGGFRRGPVEITVRRSSKAHGSGSRVHEAQDFGLIRPVTIEGIPTTPPARLAVDLGSVVSFERYEAAMDQLLGRRAMTWDDMFDHLMSHGRRGRNGVAALRAFLDQRLGSAIGDSPFEQWFLRQLRARHFPDPVTQLQIDNRDGTFLARVDVAYSAERLILEMDSLEFHLNRRSFTKDPTTRRRLRRLGWFVFEITYDMVTNDAEATFRDLRELLTERRPTGLIVP